MARIKKKGFEEQLQALEEIITQLETGDLDLDTTLSRYGEGIALLKDCRAQLSQAHQTLVEEEED